MTALRNRRCEPCPAGTPPLDPPRAAALLAELAPGWRIAEEFQQLVEQYVERTYRREPLQ